MGHGNGVFDTTYYRPYHISNLIELEKVNSRQ